MIICLPQEDELITSHLSRLAHLNGMEFDRFLTLLTSAGREKKTHCFQSLEIYQRVSALVGLSPQEYLRRHTMVPIERFAARSKDQIHNFELPTPIRQRVTLLRLNLPLYFCHLCAANEFSTRGFSTWQRIHQIKGVELCLNHGVHLHSLHGSEAKHLQPHRIAPEESIAFKRGELWREDASVRKYSDFCRSILNAPLRLHRKEISKSILHHHLERGLTTRPGSPGQRLSDLIKQHYPIAWLAQHYPHIAAKATEEHCATIDRIVSAVAGIPGESYALTLSFLFNDYQDAISHIRSPLVKSRYSKLSLASMIKLWLKQRGSFRKISRSVSRPVSLIASSFRSLGLPSSHLASDDQIEAVSYFLRTSVHDEIEKWLCANKTRFMALPAGSHAIINRAAPLPARKL